MKSLFAWLLKCSISALTYATAIHGRVAARFIALRTVLKQVSCPNGWFEQRPIIALLRISSLFISVEGLSITKFFEFGDS